MLNFLRKKKIAKRVLWFLALIIIPAFVLWGAGSFSKRRFPFKYIGAIEGKNVSFDEFVKSIKDVQIALFLNYFNQPEVLKKLQNDRSFLKRLAWENLMMNSAAKRNKITVSDKEVVGFVARFPLFTRDDVFDDKLYLYILRQSLGMTPRAFEESVRNFLLTTKERTEIIKNVTISQDELRQFYKNEFEKARVRYVVIEKDGFKEMIKISEDEITYLYGKNKENFMDAEKIVLQYIAFPHKEEDTKEKVLTDLKRSYEKLKRLPRKMEKLAQDLNLTITETSPFSQEEIVPETGAIKDINIIAFKLRPMVDILPIISEEERGTSYIVRVKEKITPRIKTKNEVSSYIENSLKDEKALILAREKANKIYEEAKLNNTHLKDMAKEYGLELRQTDLISRFDYIEGVGESYKIIDNAFELEIGVISKPIATRKGFTLIEPIEFQFMSEEKFEKEKENYKNKVLTTKKMKALEDWFDKVRANSSLNVDLDKL